MRFPAGLFPLALLLGTLPIALRMAAGADVPTKTAPTEAKPAEETDPLGANAACYVCHITFVKEELSKVHLAAKVACVKCHGLSDKHANDENIGATKPDIMYKRDQIDASCVKCHERHDVPPGKVIARFEERKLGISTKPVCSDCHGTHKIEREKPEAK
jgi:cytochrome c553